MNRRWIVPLVILLAALALAGCKDRGFEEYRAKYHCAFLGYTPDMNGANPGGISTVYQCNNGLYYVLYGQHEGDQQDKNAPKD